MLSSKVLGVRADTVVLRPILPTLSLLSLPVAHSHANRILLLLQRGILLCRISDLILAKSLVMVKHDNIGADQYYHALGGCT